MIVCLCAVGCGSNEASSKNAKTNASQNKAQSVKKSSNYKGNDMLSIIKNTWSDAKIDKSGTELDISYNMKDNLTTNMMVEGALFDIKDVLKSVQKNTEFKKYEIIKFDGMIDVTDKYGKQSKICGLELMFDQTEIQKVSNFDNITLDQLIALQGDYQTGLSSVLKKDINDKTFKILYPSN